MADDLLLEIGTEELPPKSLPQLSQALEQQFLAGLTRERIGYGAVEAFAAPRRLALHIARVEPRQEDLQETRKGPALTAAWDAQGQPTPAALGFARSCGVNIEDLQRETTNTGGWLAYRRVIPGKTLEELVPALFKQALDALPIAKRMRWSSHEFAFVRPVHWLLALYGQRVLDFELFGIRTGRSTRGHRFHHPQPMTLQQPSDYASLLESTGHVIPSFAQRRIRIREQILALAAQEQATARIQDELLDEVTALVEWPVALVGSFDASYLQVPKEALVSTMEANQKYFSLFTAEGSLCPRFIAVANLASTDPERVRQGNERVIRPRFSDAKFFWEQDQRKTLDDYLPALAQVVFHKRLGTIADKLQRIRALACFIARRLDLATAPVDRSAQLCKSDLLTLMVGEFPELQGTMGRYYALHQGETHEVADAIEQHYWPRQSGDPIPVTPTAACVALADKLDTLVGIFACGETPTGEKDPFGCRRATYGILRILKEQALPLGMHELLAQALTPFTWVADPPAVQNALRSYVQTRLKGYLTAPEFGFTADAVDAVLSSGADSPLDIARRLTAVQQFTLTPTAATLAAANKRIQNILRKSGAAITGLPDSAQLQETAELELFSATQRLAALVEPLLATGDYTEALQQLSTMAAPLNRFFDEVMVVAEDPVLRENRLRLLHQLAQLCSGVADLGSLRIAS